MTEPRDVFRALWINPAPALTLIVAVQGVAVGQRLSPGFASRTIQAIEQSEGSNHSVVWRVSALQRQTQLDESRRAGQPAVLAAGGVIGSAAGSTAAVLTHSSIVLAVTEPTLVPLGVHVANGCQGNYALDLVASAGVVAAGLLIHGATRGAGESRPTDAAYYVAIYATQIISVVAVERATAKRRARGQ